MRGSGRLCGRSIWPVFLLKGRQNVEAFSSWLSGSQEATFVLRWCLRSCIPPISLCSPAHCMASVLHQPFGWAGWVRSFPAAWWLCAECLACFRQRALGKPPNPPLSLTASVVPALSFFLSPPLLLPQQHRPSSSLSRGCFSPRGFSAAWTETEVGQHLWVSLWILMVPEACSDRWEVFSKCSWVCLRNKLGCCLCCVLPKWFRLLVM